MKLLDELPTLLILVLVAFLAFIGYQVYSDYQQNKDKSAPGTLPGSAPAPSFGSYIEDSLFSIGQSSQDLSTAQSTFWGDPIGTIKALFQ